VIHPKSSGDFYCHFREYAFRITKEGVCVAFLIRKKYFYAGFDVVERCGGRFV
jgi:hypothetical protein